MQEKLDNLSKLIEESKDENVISKKEKLEPLFKDIYASIDDDTNLLYLLKLSQLENLLTDRMIDAIPKIEPSQKTDNEYVLETSIYYARKQIEEKYNYHVKTDSLRYKSFECMTILSEVLKNLDVAHYMLDISPLFNMPCKHYIIIAYIDQFYICDLTYQQFFMLGYNFEGRKYDGPSYEQIAELGYHMKDRSVASKMIEEGYIKYADSLSYFQGFASMYSMEYKKLNEYLHLLIDPLYGSKEKYDKILLANVDMYD